MLYYYYYYLTFGIKDPEGFGEKMLLLLLFIIIIIIISKRLNVGSRKQRRTIAHGIYFYEAKFSWNYPQQGRQMQVG